MRLPLHVQSHEIYSRLEQFRACWRCVFLAEQARLKWLVRKARVARVRVMEVEAA